MRAAPLWAVTQRVVVIPYRRSGTTCWSQLPGSIIHSVLDSWPLQIGPTGCPETSVLKYHYALCNDPEERSSHLLYGRSLKSRIVHVCWKARRGLCCGLDVQGIELNYLARSEIFLLSTSSRRALGAHSVQLSIHWKLKFACAVTSPFAACSSSPKK
jgi:hypothetical protein